MDYESAYVGNLSKGTADRPWVPTGFLSTKYLFGDVSGSGCQLLNVSRALIEDEIIFNQNFTQNSSSLPG